MLPLGTQGEFKCLQLSRFFVFLDLQGTTFCKIVVSGEGLGQTLPRFFFCKREKGFEPSTSALARQRSAIEPLSHVLALLRLRSTYTPYTQRAYGVAVQAPTCTVSPCKICQRCFLHGACVRCCATEDVAYTPYTDACLHTLHTPYLHGFTVQVGCV